MSVLWESAASSIFYFRDTDASTCIHTCNNYYFKFSDKKNYEYFR